MVYKAPGQAALPVQGLQVGKGERLQVCQGLAPGPGEGPELSDFLCSLLAGGGTTCLLLCLPLGPSAPPGLSLVLGLNRCLVAVIKPKTRARRRAKAPEVGGRCPGSAALAPPGWPCSRPAQTHCCTPTPRLGLLPFNVPAASGQAISCLQAQLSFL